jgi:probable rRNA maturation factor
MTHLNETFLKHKGSTDVLAFDYSEKAEPGSVLGEIFVCVEEAMIQSARFRTDWRSELVRYVVHATLHLLGYDDHRPASRREMKRVENQTLKKLAGRFDLKQMGS